MAATEFRIIPYREQLQLAADEAQVDLKAAVIAAGKSDSVYYRWRNDQCEPTLRVANDVMQSIERLALVPHDGDPAS